MELEFGGGGISVTGAMQYSSGTRGGSVVGVLLQIGVNDYPAEVVLDTVAPFLVCTPQLALAMGTSELVPLLKKATILFRGVWLEGNIYLLTVAFAPDDNMGDGTTVAVRGFVPTEPDQLEDVLPFSSLGWFSCLEATPFAIDPGRHTFYYC